MTNFGKRITMNEAINFVIVNARFMGDAPVNARYFVRFPSPFSSMTFFAEDTHELAPQIYKYGMTPEGKAKWTRKLAKQYSKMVEPNYEVEENEEDDE
jgi:hypothetical protein